MSCLKPRSWSSLWSKKKKTRLIPPKSRSCWWWWWWSWLLTSGDGGGRCLSPKTHHHPHWTYIYKKHQLVLKYTKKERKKTHWGPNDVSDTLFGSIFILPALCPCPLSLLLCWLCWCWLLLVVGSTWLWLLYLLCWSSSSSSSATGYCHWCDGDVVMWWGIDGGGKATRVTVTRWWTLLNSPK